MDHETSEQSLAERVARLENKVDHLITLFERATGALLVIKIGGAMVVGLAAIWTFLADHIHLR